MTRGEYIAERDRYLDVALPTAEDFARYTAAFFGWIDDVNARARAKWPRLFDRPREPLPLFDGKEAAA